MEPKFIADAMLGRLARWLRVAGCDVEYFSRIDDSELIARGAAGRLILTRDTRLVRRRGARDNCFFVTGDDYRDQLRQVLEVFTIDPFARFLSRCLECNTPLAAIDRHDVSGKVPPYVFATQTTFRICPACGRLYWGGTHRERMSAHLRSLTDTQ